ncbi:MAG: hypothetical protein O3A25_07975 [Acidobacteria bacterium]|nr:hypothetical protein [Acidobacteriota bacterium]
MARWEHYEAGALVRVEEDLDFDGGADKWETREAGRVATVAFDENGDGRPERRLVYDAGVLVVSQMSRACIGIGWTLLDSRQDHAR